MSNSGEFPDRSVLLVEDDPAMRRLLETYLAARGHEVLACSDAESGWSAFLHAGQPLVILDLNLPGMDGLELCRKIRSNPRGPYTVILVVTARDSAEDLQAVLDGGADDYVTKPIDPKLFSIRLAIAERRVRDLSALRTANEKIAFLEEQSRSRTFFQGLIGRCPAMQEVYRRVRLAAESDVTVLILGESGTGKELVAGAIHSLSVRSARPFIGINCSAIPESLLESELFGHVKGAFTGAVADKAGVFAAASGGTLFLDEIGEMSPSLQVKLLRVLQERQIQRVGDARPARIDVRLMTATHRNLETILSSGQLREDFYYRIKVFEIVLPPLRGRVEDIPLLVNHFISEFSRRYQKPVEGIRQEALLKLIAYPWPGNVRELRNTIERAFVAIRGNQIGVEDLPPEIREARPAPMAVARPAMNAAADALDEERIIEALRVSRGNQSQAAKNLGVSRVTLWKKIRRFDIKVKEILFP